MNCIFGGPNAYHSKRKQKLTFREVNAVAPATLEYMWWSEVPMTLSDHLDVIPKPSRYPLVLPPTINEVRLKKNFIDGGSCLNILFANTLPELGLSVEALEGALHPSMASFQEESATNWGRLCCT